MNQLGARDSVQVVLDGQTLRVKKGLPLASALIDRGELLLGRSVKYHRPRAAFCLQGSCGACLVRIDGQPNQRACRPLVYDGMKIERQNVYPSAALDVVGATDFFFPRGMDHHTLMVKAPKAVHAVMQKIARQLAGLGKLPETKSAPIAEATSRHVELLVIGGGPAGLAAATAAAKSGLRVLLIDENARVGGSLWADPHDGPARVVALVAAAHAAGVELVSDAVALAWYGEDHAPGRSEAGLIAVSTPRGLLLVSADRYLYATGSYDQNALFADNDVPGVLSARAVGRLLVRDGVTAGQNVIVLGGGPYAHALQDALRTAGATVMLVDGTSEQLVAAVGHRRVKAVRLVRDGKERKVKCDLVAIAALPAPATELPREHGVAVAWVSSVGGFHAVADQHGRTKAKNVWAVGDVTGFIGTEAAEAVGAYVGAQLK